MASGQAGQADDGIPVDADQASGGPDSAVLGQVVEHGEGLVLGQMGVEEGRALALGEARLAGLAVKQADVIVLAVAGADGEVCGVASAVEWTIGVLTAEACEIVHGIGSPGRAGRVGIVSWSRDASGVTTLIPHPVFSSFRTRPVVP
jgi:hypothetical protein